MSQLKLQPSGTVHFPSDQMGIPQISQLPFNQHGLAPSQSGGLFEANDMIVNNNIGCAQSPLVMKRESSISQFFPTPQLKDEP